MRRIVHYYPGAMGHSGVTFALWSWARAQARAGHDVRVLHAPEAAPGATVPFVAKDLRPGLTVAAVPHAGSGRLTLRPLQLDRQLGTNDLLVLHEGWVTANLFAAEAAQRAGIPYVVMPHGVYEPAWMAYLRGPRAIRHMLERRLLERAAAVHVFFESEVHDVARLAPDASFIAVPTGFELSAQQWIGGGGYLAWIGRVDPIHKGLDTLAAAIAQLPAGERPVVRIHGYDYKGGIDRLRGLIAGYGIARWVRLEGPIGGADKVRFLREADGYLHPSRWECHSIALLENLALGTPCVVSRSIHIATTLEISSAALLAEPGRAPLAAAIARLSRERHAFAARGRALVSQAFNWDTLIPRFQASLAGLGLA